MKKWILIHSLIGALCVGIFGLILYFWYSTNDPGSPLGNFYRIVALSLPAGAIVGGVRYLIVQCVLRRSLLRWMSGVEFVASAGLGSLLGWAFPFLVLLLNIILSPIEPIISDALMGSIHTFLYFLGGALIEVGIAWMSEQKYRG